MDPDQTFPLGGVRSGFILFAINPDQTAPLGGVKSWPILYATRQIRQIYIPDEGLFERNM